MIKKSAATSRSRNNGGLFRPHLLHHKQLQICNSVPVCMNESLMLNIYNSISIGHVSLALENEVGGTWGQEVHIHHVDIYVYMI